MATSKRRVSRRLRGALGLARGSQPRPGRAPAEPRRWAAEGLEAPGRVARPIQRGDSAGVGSRRAEIAREFGGSCPAPTAQRR